MKVTIDSGSGFCFGVQKAISKAEAELEKSEPIVCLGEIVHNEKEVNRLENKGLQFINQADFRKLKNTKVLIRAHGEPPETYLFAKENNIEIVEATCPIVLAIQKKVNQQFESGQKQIVIFGNRNHPEVIGLAGQTGHQAIIIENENDLSGIDFSRPLFLISQTTKSKEDFKALIDKIKSLQPIDFQYYDSICRYVSNRSQQIKDFASANQVILFISGKNSSNGKYLFGISKEANPMTYFVSGLDEIEEEWFVDIETVGVCGATSTPQWLMEQVKEKVLLMNEKK